MAMTESWRTPSTWRDDENENSGSGKSKNSNGISGYGQFCHGKSGSNTPPWWAPDNYVYGFGVYG